MTDSDTDSDSDSDLPPGCEVITISSAMHWEGERGVDGDRMVWMEYDFGLAVPKLMMRQLSTGVETVLLSDPGYEEHPVIKGDWVFWERETDSPDWQTREIFRMSVSSSTPEQITNNYCGEGRILPGIDYLFFIRVCVSNGDSSLHQVDMNTLESTLVANDVEAPPGTGGLMFDGERYVAWGWHDEDGPTTYDRIYLYDIQNPGPPSLLCPACWDQVGGVIAGQKIYAATLYSGVSHDLDIWIWDIATGEMSWLDHSDWDQLAYSVDGHIIVYEDTEDLASNIFTNGGYSHVEIKDLETGATRRITNVENKYAGAAIEGKYLMYAAGGWSKKLVVCDLEAGGFIDAEGHVCPVGGCVSPDGGVDGGALDAGSPDGGK